MLLEPRVVGRALDREVERDLDARACGRPRRAGRSPCPCRARDGSHRDHPRGRRSPRGSRDRPSPPTARCSAPSGSSCRSGGSAAGRGRRSRARRAAAGLLDPLEPAPGAWEELVPGAEARPLPLDVGLERARRDLAVPVLRAEPGCSRMPRLRSPGPKSSSASAARRRDRLDPLPASGRARRASSRSGRPTPRSCTASGPARMARSFPASDRSRSARAGSPATSASRRGR